MNEIIEKLVQVEREMATEKGRLLVFALFLREDAPDLWDVIVAAPWVTPDKSGSLQYISSKLSSALAPDELTKLSRIVLIEPDSPALSALQKAVHVEHGTAEIRDGNFFGLPIKHAYLITSRRDVDRESTEPVQPTR
ncbi:MAG: hypothetical protein M1376_10950 [Planctomycetes bacterium]|nr:hypothetical protein [Planctomycetota bacterium]